MYKQSVTAFCLILIAIIGFEFWWLQNIKVVCKNCNVVLISLDTLTAKHMPCYGYEKKTMPNLCEFGKKNLFFSNSYSQAHWTRPSQMSVFTGLYPTTHQSVVPYAKPLNEKYKTITEILKNNGYATYYFGPTFDDTSWDPSMGRGFDFNGQNYYQSDELTHWTKAFEILEQNQKKKQPTFIYLQTYYPHSPYTTGKENLTFFDINNQKKYNNVPLNYLEFTDFTAEKKEYIMESLRQRIKKGEEVEILSGYLKSLEDAKSLNEAKNIVAKFKEIKSIGYDYDWYYDNYIKKMPIEVVYSLYDERIYQLDKKLKNFLTTIEKKFSKDTIVVIFSDHGETFGERGSYDHCNQYPNCLYNETIKVPLIIKIPGVKNRKIEGLAQGIDIYPTILKTLDINISSYIEGEELTGLISGKQKEAKKKYIISEEYWTQATLTDKKWSLYLKNMDSFELKNAELYDLENDKNQLKNVIQTYPEIAQEKLEILKNFYTNKTAKEKPDWSFF